MKGSITFYVFLFCCVSSSVALSEGKRALGRRDVFNEEQRGVYHNRMYNETHHHHAKSWQILEEVDGLKNEDIVAMITSSSVQEFVFLRSRSVNTV